MKVNQLKAGAILSYVSIALNAIIQLAYTPVMLSLLGQSEYGLFTLVSSVVSYLGLLTFGTNGAYLRFYFKEREEGGEEATAKLNGTFLLIFSLLAAVALAAGVVMAANAGWVFGDKLTAVELEKSKILLFLLAINLAITIVGSVFDSHIAAQEKFFFQRILTILGYIFNPFVAIPLMLLGYGATGLVVASLVVTLLKTAMNVGFCFGRLKMRFSFRASQRLLVKSIFAFSFFLFLNQIIDQINWSVDSFLLGRFHGTGEVAIYGLASRINQLYLAFSVAVSSVFAPRINRIVAHEKNPNEQLLALMVKVGRIQGLILFLLLMGLTLLGRPFLMWMGGNDAVYLRSYAVFLMLIIPVTLPLMQNLGIEIQRAKNKHQFRSIIYAIMAALNIVASIPLSKLFGSLGAAVGTAASLLIGNGLIMNWYYHKHLQLDMCVFWKSILSLAKGLLLPMVYCLICAFTVDLFSPPTFVLVGVGLVAVYGFSMWKFGMNEEEKALCLGFVKKFKRGTKHDQ